MTPDFKRRLGIFGMGAAIGTMLSVLLFRWAADVRETEPREVQKIEVILSSCALKPGDLFEQRCVEKRVVAHQFAPPNVVQSSEVGLYVGQPVKVAIEAGSAVRTVDFEAEVR